MASVSSVIPVEPMGMVHHHDRPMQHHSEHRVCNTPCSKSADLHMYPQSDHLGDCSQGSPSSTTPAAASSLTPLSIPSRPAPPSSNSSHSSTASNSSTGSRKVSPELQKRGEDTIREILDRLQKQQNELGPNASAQDSQEMQRTVHTHKLNPDLLKQNIIPGRHSGHANLRSREE